MEGEAQQTTRKEDDEEALKWPALEKLPTYNCLRKGLLAASHGHGPACEINVTHFSSYANAVISTFEDPEKILEQAVLEMNDDLTKMRQATAQFAMLESSSVDDDLANLKKELSGSSKKGELPPGRSGNTSTNTGIPFRDSEIEVELDRLRQRAKEF